MKRKITIVLAVVVLACLCFATFSVQAAGATLTASNAEGKQGTNVTVTATLSGNPGIAGLVITPKCDNSGITLSSAAVGNISGFAMTSGTNLVFDAASNVTANGVLCTATFTIGSSVQPGSYDVYFTVRSCSNLDAEDVTVTTVKGKIKVNCATHRFGTWSKLNDTQHSRTCSACSYVEKANHGWNSGTVTKTANCKEAGNRQYTCTTCSAKKDEAIAKTSNHTYGSWSTTKTATCTVKGQQKRTCSTCNKVEYKDIAVLGHNVGNWTTKKAATCTETGSEERGCSRCTHKETRSISALGHNLGNWSTTKAATCTETGSEERGCSRCTHKETRSTSALGHNFETPKIIKEATISSTGLKEGKCKACGNTTSEVIPCTAKDASTGIVIEMKEGVFQEGAQLTVTDIMNKIGNSFDQVATEVTAYNVSVQCNGAEAAPGGNVEIIFTVPEGYSDNLRMYKLADNKATPIGFVPSADGKTITVTTDALGDFVLCDLDTAGAASTDAPASDVDQNQGGNDLFLIWLIIGAAVLVAVIVIVIALIVSKKKK